jgi:short-chain fatty acids transporter
MRITHAIERAFRKYLPSPFTIAVLLTLISIILAWAFTENTSSRGHLEAILTYWETGIWNRGLIVFAYQMMLILVLGHVLVLSKPMERLILRLTSLVSTPANAALFVALPTMLVSFFNWGLGLIFGAILARKVGEYAREKQIAINYPLVGAAGYTGLMVWHGGISGSAPLKVSESGHIKDLMANSATADTLAMLPDNISTALTVFSSWNIGLFLLVVLLVSMLIYRLGKRLKPTDIALPAYSFGKDKGNPEGAERLDRSKFLSVAFGILILIAFVIQYMPVLRSLNISPDMLNFFMLGLALVLHGSFHGFLRAVEEAIGDTAGILIQFPLYFGIMGVMGSSGMIAGISDFFVSVSNTTTLPVFTFLSAALVNIFVPSGGGQWAIQGPMVLESALQLNVPLPKAVMAMAYGDQITNMLQPFWALPLLGITKLKAREILPYTLMFMLVGMLVFISGLLLF